MRPLRVSSGSSRIGLAAVYAGDEEVLPGFSAEKFVGRHYVIESIGEAPRGARDVQVQGVLVISPKGGEP